MTNPTTVPVDEIRGLIEERERYESWLSALEARRGATQPHVFERVRGDYDGRLRDVRDRLLERVAPLRDEETAIGRQQDDVVQRLTERQDELAEVELRMLVGEFDAEDGERRVQATAAAVRELDAERRAVATDLDGIRSLIARASGPSAASPATAPSAPISQAPVAPPATEPPAIEPPVIEHEPVAPAPELGSTPTPEPEPVPAPAPDWTVAGPPRPAEEETFVGTGARLDSLAASLGGSVAPPASPVAAGSNQEKTLRCQDCGEMNYPTEWYCERCGGELAAL